MDKQYVILCVDDEPYLLNGLVRILTFEGYKVLAALSPFQAMELLRDNHVDFVITDLRMPDMDGVEFLIRLSVEYPALKSILLSGYDDILKIEEAKKIGNVFCFLAKPFDVLELCELMRKALEGA